MKQIGGTFPLKMWNKFVYLLACVGAALAQNESRTVQIDQGSLRGYKDPQAGVFSFHDVPYATAPTGSSKFKVGYWV